MCGQLGYMERISKCQEEVKVVVSSFGKKWLICSGTTNHVTYESELFTELHKTDITKVKIANGEYVEVKGKGTVAIQGQAGLTLIHDVLYVPKLTDNQLSVPQLLQNGYKVLFEDKKCMVKDSKGREEFRVEMEGKRFVLDFMNKDHVVIHKVRRFPFPQKQSLKGSADIEHQWISTYSSQKMTLQKGKTKQLWRWLRACFVEI